MKAERRICTIIPETEQQSERMHLPGKGAGGTGESKRYPRRYVKNPVLEIYSAAGMLTPFTPQKRV